MRFEWKSKTEKRMIEIQETLADQERKKQIMTGETLDFAKGQLAAKNLPLLEEFEVLKVKYQVESGWRQTAVNVASIAIALLIAFLF